MKIGAGAAALLALLLAAGCPGHAPAVDLLLIGGTVIDGTGGPPTVEDLAIDRGRIVARGRLRGRRATRVFDANGLVVAPGFVDLHSHADLILLADPATQERLLAAKLRQGVTSVIVGNCGLGAAPTGSSALPVVSEINGWMTPAGVAAPAMSVADYLTRLEQGGVLLNVGTLVPHGPLRFTAMGAVSRAPSTAELAAMRATLDEGLAAGAFGLSVGLIYPPGMYSPTSELVALATGVAARDRLFSAHVRGSSETLLEATRELIEIARSSGARVHHSHLEAVGRQYWPRIGQILDLEDRARQSGLQLSHDLFPYTRAATMMSAIFPPWSLEGGLPALLDRLRDPETRQRVRTGIDRQRPEWPPWQPGGWPHNLVGAVGWSGIRIASLPEGAPQELVGRSLADIADERHRDPFDVVADLMLEHRGQIGQLVDQISGSSETIDALLAILAHPAAAVITDAEDYGRGRPHPAHAGSFVRALRLNREHGLMAVEELVRKMSGYPASLIGLDRGHITVGAPADLVVLDPQRVTDRATWAEPRLEPRGIALVLLNGQVVVEQDRFLVGGLHGRVLRASAVAGTPANGPLVK